APLTCAIQGPGSTAAATSAIAESGTHNSTSSAPASSNATPRSRRRAEIADPTRPAPMTWIDSTSESSSSDADTGHPKSTATLWLRAVRLRVHIAVLAALAVLLAGPRVAFAGTLQFAPCGKGLVECATVAVPLDRTGATPGTVSLYVERLAPLGTPRGVMFLVAGGPGQASARAFDLANQGMF